MEERIIKDINNLLAQLFQKMKEAGYEWDSEKKELKKAEQKPADIKEYDFHGTKFIPKFAKGDMIKDKKRGEVSTIEDFSYDTGLYTHTYGQFPITIQDNYEIIAQKPAWNIWDENLFRCAIDAVKQESKVRTDGCLDEEVGGMVIDWLKSLKDKVQPKQGRSEEDWNYIADLISYFDGSSLQHDTPDVISWLKSLRPQNHWKPSGFHLECIEDAISLYEKHGINAIGLKEILEELKKLKN